MLVPARAAISVGGRISALYRCRRSVASVPSSSGSNASSSSSQGRVLIPQLDPADLKKIDPDELQPIHIDDLPRAHKRFAKQFEKVNEQRIKEIFLKNYKNQIGLAALAALVAGIYWYTMHAVKQETFLEEIDEEVERETGKPAVPTKEDPSATKK